MGNILAFPSPSRAASPVAPAASGALALTRPAINVAARRYMDLAEVARRLCMEDCARRTLIDRLRGLHDHAGMPLPRNPRFVGGRPAAGAQAIHAGSRWDRGEMLAWLDNGDGGTGAAFVPCDPAPAADAATRSRLHAAAARLCERERKRA